MIARIKVERLSFKVFYELLDWLNAEADNGVFDHIADVDSVSWLTDIDSGWAVYDRLLTKYKVEDLTRIALLFNVTIEELHAVY